MSVTVRYETWRTERGVRGVVKCIVCKSSTTTENYNSELRTKTGASSTIKKLINTLYFQPTGFDKTGRKSKKKKQTNKQTKKPWFRSLIALTGQ